MSAMIVKCADGVYRTISVPSAREIRRIEVERDFDNSEFMRGVNEWRSIPTSRC